VFTMKELEPYFEMSVTMEINGMTFTLSKQEDLSGVCAVWQNDSYLIYATPMHEGIAVPVQIIDCNEQEIGMDGYPVEVDDFERYSKCVKVLTEKILRRARI
jgi:hypothetical protein